MRLSRISVVLPEPETPVGQVFNGWKFEGIDGTYTTLTEDLLTALSKAYAEDGTVIAATAQFYTPAPITPVTPTEPEDEALPFTDVAEASGSTTRSSTSMTRS